MAEIMARRHKVSKVYEWSLASPMLEETALDAFDEGSDDDEVLREVADAHEAVIKNAAETKVRTAKAVVAAAASMAAAAAPVGEMPPRTPIDWDRPAYTQPQAKIFLPPNAKISNETVIHCRWRVTAPYLGERHKMYIRGDTQSDHEGLRSALLLVWAAYTRTTEGERCPWLLDDIGG